MTGVTEKIVFTYNKQNEKLVGRKLSPFKKDISYPAIILVHGFGVTKEEGGMFTDLAQALTKHNFLVFYFDFSGRGESGGDYTHTSLTKLADDLKSILAFIKKDPQVNKNKIGIQAQSFGTAVTVALAPKVDCLILTGSISQPKKIMKKIFQTYNPKGISLKIMKATGEKIKMNPGFWQDLEKYNNLSMRIGHFSCPIMLIHGEKDETVPTKEMENYFKHIKTEKKKIVLKNADHGLRPVRSKMYKLAISWFKKHLGD